jgi:hypothetical protein
MANTMGSFNFGDKAFSDVKQQPSARKKDKMHPTDIPHLHDAFTKARGHFNIDHLETDAGSGYKNGKFEKYKTFGQRN